MYALSISIYLYIYIYICVLCVYYIIYHERILLLVYLYFNTILLYFKFVCPNSFSLCIFSFAVSAINSKTNFYTHRMVYIFRYNIIYITWVLIATKVTGAYLLSCDHVNAAVVPIARICFNGRVYNTIQSTC